MRTEYFGKRISRRRFLQTSTALAAGWGVLPHRGTIGRVEAAETPRGELVVGISQDLLSLDPHNHVNISDWSVHRHFFDPLVEKDATGTILPMLAESWELVDRVTWKFHLRQGVKFHNGESFNAACVKATMDRMLDPNTKLPQAGLFWSSLQEVEVEDPYTVLFRGKLPMGSLLHNLAVTEILPAQAMQEPEFFRKPVGTGPFKIARWVRGNRLELEANREYWKPGVPKVEKLTWRFMPETSTRLAGLKAGEIDIIDRVPYEQIEPLQKDPETMVIPVEGVESMYVGFQMAKKPFHDKRVRLAMNYAIDKTAIIQDLLLGYGTLATAPMAPGVFAYAEQTPYPYDPEGAKTLLAEAGYPNGFSMELIVLKGLYTKGLEVAQAIAGQLSLVGIRATINDMEVARTREVRAAGTFDMFFAGWVTMNRDADFALWRNFHSSKKGQFMNVSQIRYDNPTVDALLEKGQTTLDEQERARAYKEAQKLIWDDVPWIFLYYSVNVYGLRKRVQHFQPRPDYFTIVKEVGVG